MDQSIRDEIREHACQISTLSDFQYANSSGRDQGNNVRRKSQSLVLSVNDKERIQEVRQKAAINRDKRFRPEGFLDMVLSTMGYTMLMKWLNKAKQCLLMGQLIDKCGCGTRDWDILPPGPAHSVVWDALVPSKKRTCVIRQKQSSVEKLTKDFCTILHEQASHFSGSYEEDLLFESKAPIVSVEIGHGSVLIRHPSSMGQESESEASSISVDNKHCRADECYSTPPSRLSLCGGKNANGSYLGKEKFKKPNDQMMQLEQAKRDKGKT